MRKISIFFLLVLISIWNNSLYSQQDNFTFDNYSLDNGLSNNVIHCACQDKHGFMWFGTNHGVCRFDGYKFTTFRNDPFDSTSLLGLLARVIFMDSKGTIWVGTESGGLNKFNSNTEKFEHILWNYSDTTIGTSVKTIAEDKRGNLWLGTNIGIRVYNPQTGKVKTFVHKDGVCNSVSDNYVRLLTFDSQGYLWVGTNKGLDRYDIKTGKFTHIYEKEPGLADEIWEIYKDSKGLIWIGTYNNGLYVINPGTLAIRKILIDPANERSKTVRAIVEDNSGIFWIGTRDGLYLFNSKTGKKTFYNNDEYNPKSLIHGSILKIKIDKDNNVWICTRGGISLMVPERQIFRRYRALENNSHYLNNGEIYAIWNDESTGDVWLGTDKGGINILHPGSQTFTYLKNIPGNSNSLSDNCVKAFLDDKQGNIWIGTFKGGINIYNLKTRKITFLKHNPSDPESLINDCVWALHSDKKNNIWVGTNEGLERYDVKTRKFIHCPELGVHVPVIWISEDAEGDLWIGQGSSTSVFRPGKGVLSSFVDQGRWFYQDTKGRNWMATMNNGLVLYDKKKGPLKYFDEKSGLPNNQVFHILEDKNGMLWLSTANGLAMFNPGTKLFTNYDAKDGLQGNQFQYGAAYKTLDGALLFGGVNGFTIFNPETIRKNMQKPEIILTDLKIFNKSVKIGDETGILKSAVSEIKSIEIPYKYNIISFEFAALNYSKPEQNQYKYKLEGFDENWNDANNQHQATYTNLDPGFYIFKVKASNNDNVWNEKELQLRVEILPPFWRTWWFKLIILIGALFSVYLIVRFVITKEKLKHQLALEKLKAVQTRELDNVKLKFFTNISHEIRTPLTLIVGPLERILNTEMTLEQIKSLARIMLRNSNLLLRLINQLLDFRKLEAGSLKLELQKGDIIPFIRETVNSFSTMAADKGIRLKFNPVVDSYVVLFDADKLGKILNNLISNALKFTNKAGSVNVNVVIGLYDSQIVSKSTSTENKYIEISVKDTGIGISDDEQKKIFTRFYQSEDNTGKRDTGTGIGLALTKELVNLHNGEIKVESSLENGARFIVRLPIVQDEVDSNVSNEIPQFETGNVKNDDFSDVELISEKIILIVEDNPDVLQFIKTNFENSYRVVGASDGKEGLALAQKIIPDIILTDVMMPGMDGNELCRKIKRDEKTSHIPVIMITALSSKEHTLEGLSNGADDFISKPFDLNVLQSKIENILSLRKAIREKYSGRMVISPTNVSISSPDEKFIKKAIEIVEKNIEDSDLDTEMFSDEMGVSRMQMYRKLSALTGMTIKEFIRDIRLKRAAQMLSQKKLNISEVAYSVGFKDLSHFRKCFREKYGMNATEFMERKDIEMN
jgi:ligand-binding sensor domain-containing protein/signal transduction histidine kinase/DNA-binding response OmpR family regulator